MSKNPGRIFIKKSRQGIKLHLGQHFMLIIPVVLHRCIVLLPVVILLTPSPGLPQLVALLLLCRIQYKRNQSPGAMKEGCQLALR